MTDPLTELRAAFLARCTQDLRQLRGLAAADPEVRRIVHRLAGAAGSFGYLQLGEIAAQLDDRLRQAPPQAADLERLVQALAATTRESSIGT